jgi:hypothetical protein
LCRENFGKKEERRKGGKEERKGKEDKKGCDMR